MKKILITWQCMLEGGGVVDRENTYNVDELKQVLGINSMALEFLKLPFGLSKHTKESVLLMLMGSTVPRDREKAFELCEKFEKFATELCKEMEQQLGDNGVLIIPTLPTVAYKHNISLLKTSDFRFPALFNVLQLPVTHAHFGLDKKHKMPFGFSLASKPYKDQLTLAMAEEIELSFGGWTEPSLLKQQQPQTTAAATELATQRVTTGESASFAKAANQINTNEAQRQQTTGSHQEQTNKHVVEA